MSEWIKCADKMPPLTGDLLIEYWVVNNDTLRVKLGLCEQEVGRTCYMQVNENSGRWVTYNYKPYAGNVTHYMVVVPPPRRKTNTVKRTSPVTGAFLLE